MFCKFRYTKTRSSSELSFCNTIEKAKIFQKIADDYLTDTKIVLLVENFDNLDEIVKCNIDAVKLKETK